jgi:hypothetical protein
MTLQDEQDVLSAAIIASLHALVDIAQDESLDSDVRLSAAGIILEHSTSYIIEPESNNEEDEGKSDDTAPSREESNTDD